MKLALPLAPSKKQYYINQAYINYVNEAGFVPIMVNPFNEMQEYADMCDGLLLPGGIDIDPIFYGVDNKASYGVKPEQDDFDRKIYNAFLLAGKPIFGICRGFQLLILEFLRTHKKAKWLDFRQHINGHTLSNDRETARDVPTHYVECAGRIYGVSENFNMPVNSMHHQCLVANYNMEPKKKSSIIITARTRRGIDGAYTGKKAILYKYYVVEGFEIIGQNSRIAGVQWHPEELKDYRLLQTFFNEEEENAPNTVEVEAEGRVQSIKTKAAENEG